MAENLARAILLFVCWFHKTNSDLKNPDNKEHVLHCRCEKDTKYPFEMNIVVNTKLAPCLEVSKIFSNKLHVPFDHFATNTNYLIKQNQCRHNVSFVQKLNTHQII